MKKDSNQLITREILKEELNQELRKYATRDELNERFFEFENKIDKKFDLLKEELVSWRDQIFRDNDVLVKEIRWHREDHAAIHFNYRDIKERVTTLEDTALPETTVS